MPAIYYRGRPATRAAITHAPHDWDEGRTACGARVGADDRPEGGRPCLACRRALDALWRNRGG